MYIQSFVIRIIQSEHMQAKHNGLSTVRDFDDKKRQKETQKTPKKLVIFASYRST